MIGTKNLCKLIGLFTFLLVGKGVIGQTIVQLGETKAICKDERVKLGNENLSSTAGCVPNAPAYLWETDPASAWTSSETRPIVTPTSNTTYVFKKDGVELGRCTVKVIDKITIHPTADDNSVTGVQPANCVGDFENGKAGRIIISDVANPKSFYTKVNTTKANSVAQTDDRKIKITVHLPVSAAGTRVYFRVNDPPDLSPYISPQKADDNRDSIKKGTLDKTFDDATGPQNINGVQVAAAEVELTFTNRYAGDNYVVEASLDPNFQGCVVGTPAMVAWKRIYLEQDNMYQKGATVLVTKAPDGDALNNDVLEVDDVSDFAVGNAIQIIRNIAGVATLTPATIIVVTPAVAPLNPTITVSDLPFTVNQYDGIKLTADNTTYSVGTYLLENAYGSNYNAVGTDGGTFVEFKLNYNGSGNIPKFPAPLGLSKYDFFYYWFFNKDVGFGRSPVIPLLPPLEKNVVQLAVCGLGSSLGLSVATYNVSLIITQNHGVNCPNSITDCYAQTVVHELGHQFNVGSVPIINPLHEDLSPPPVVLNHMGTQPCEMQYAGFDDSGDVEFDIDCINEIRNLKDNH